MGNFFEIIEKIWRLLFPTEPEPVLVPVDNRDRRPQPRQER